MPYLSASAAVIHYEEALYQVYAPLPHLYLYCVNLGPPLEFSVLCSEDCQNSDIQIAVGSRKVTTNVTTNRLCLLLEFTSTVGWYEVLSMQLTETTQTTSLSEIRIYFENLYYRMKK